jgi:hypothetical protein
MADWHQQPTTGLHFGIAANRRARVPSALFATPKSVGWLGLVIARNKHS